MKRRGGGDGAGTVTFPQPPAPVPGIYGASCECAAAKFRFGCLFSEGKHAVLPDPPQMHQALLNFYRHCLNESFRVR
jgi:hypothetical protein